MSLTPQTERAVARFCRRVVRDHGLPGLSVAIVRDGEPVYASGFGSRDLAGNRPATARTLYGIGSCTKSMAAVAVLQLVESGMCDLEDPVADHLPVTVGDEDDPVTIHHLLSHSSGLPSLGVSETLLARRIRLPDPGIALGDREDFLAHVNGADGERTDPPGERFAYCNTGYNLVGQLVAELTGKGFDEYVSDHVFAPLGMERATFDGGEFARDDDHMTQYRRDEDGDLVAASLPTREVSQAAGGVLASVEELTRYLRLHLNGGSFGGTDLLEPESLARAHAGHVDTPDGPYGYGWFRDDDWLDGRTLVGHSGSIVVSSAYLGFLPDDDAGVALASNTSPAFPLAVVGEGVLATVFGEDPDEAVPFFRRQRRHDELTGEYTAYEGVMSATVTECGNALAVTYEHPLNQSTKPLFPVEDVGDVGKAGDVEDDGDERTTGAREADTVYRYYSLGESGQRQPVEFRRDGDDLSLLVDRWRLHKVGD